MLHPHPTLRLPTADGPQALMSSAAASLDSSALMPSTEGTQTHHRLQALLQTGSKHSSPLHPTDTAQQASLPKHNGPWAATMASANRVPLTQPSSRYSSCSSQSHNAAQAHSHKLGHRLSSCCRPTLCCRSSIRACFRLLKLLQQKLLQPQLHLHPSVTAQQCQSAQSHHHHLE